MTTLLGGCAQPDMAAIAEWWASKRTTPGTVPLPEHFEVRWIGLDDPSTEEVIELIKSGDKTGTFSLPWLIDAAGLPDTQVGDFIVLVDFQAQPRLVVRLTDIRTVLFGDVTARDTSIDGSPVRDLSVWIPLHTMYWNNLLAPFGREVSDDMPVLIEPFELIDV